MPEGLDERLEAFLQRRRQETAHPRRQRKYLIAIASLGVVCLALAVSVVSLAVRLAAIQVPGAVAPDAPGPAATAGERRAADPAGRVGEVTVEEALAVLMRALGEEGRLPGRGETPEAASPGGSATTPPEAVEPPSRPAPREAIAPEPAPAPEAPHETDPARRMAAWMLQTYGKAGAEERARAVAAFHDPRHPDADFWRSVLAHIQSPPER